MDDSRRCYGRWTGINPMSTQKQTYLPTKVISAGVLGAGVPSGMIRSMAFRTGKFPSESKAGEQVGEQTGGGLNET
mgnify:CR=1 FL=1